MFRNIHISECSESIKRLDSVETPCEVTTNPNPTDCSGCPFWKGIMSPNQGKKINKTELWTIAQRNNGVPLGDW